MLQIRGRDKQNNLTYVGEWIKIPQIAKVISCVGGYSTDRATIVDKGKKTLCSRNFQNVKLRLDFVEI